MKPKSSVVSGTADHRGGREVAGRLPDAAGEQAFGILRIAGFIGQGTDGKAYFAVVGGDQVGDEIAVGSVVRVMEQPSEGGGEFVAAQTAVIPGGGEWARRVP